MSTAIPQNYKWHVLVVVMIGTMMAALDTSIVNVCIPTMMADFGVGVDDIEWVLTGYMLSFAVTIPLTAWLRDIIGHRKLYIIAIFIFTLGSILCGFAWNLPSLIAARVIQALGGGVMTPISMSMITEVFEPQERSKAMGYWGVGVIVGPTVGPTLGGILTKYFGWRSIFLINLPIGIIGLFLAIYLLQSDKPHQDERKVFDLWGFIFLTSFLLSFLLGVSNGEKEGWTSHYVVTCSLISFFSFVGFLLVESLTKNGIVDLSLFKFPVYTISMLVIGVRSIALFGGIFLLPLFLQREMGYDEIQSGLILFPGAFALVFLMPIGGKLGDMLGAKIPALVGLFALFVFMFMYRNIDINTRLFDIILPTIIRAFGMALLMAPVTAAAMNSVPRNKAGHASAMMSLIQQIAGSIGIAFLATILSHRIRFHLAINTASLESVSSNMQQVMNNVAIHAHNVGYGHEQSSMIAKSFFFQKVAEFSTVRAFQDSFIVGAIIVAFAFIPAFFLPRIYTKKRMTKEQEEAQVIKEEMLGFD